MAGLWLAAEACRPCQCQTIAGADGSVFGQDTTTPGLIQWIIALLLAVLLVSGLVRVYRVLHRGEHLVLIRGVPEGMRTMECGACHTLQYITIQGTVFVCFSCHCANRVPMEIPRVEEQELVVQTGPLQRFEFRKGGENYWQETKHEPLEESTVEAPSQLPQEVPTDHDSTKGPFTEPSENPQNAQEGPSIHDVRIEAPPDPHNERLGPRGLSEALRPVVIGRQATNDSWASNGLPLCVVCLDAVGDMVLLPCSHGSVCEECVTRIVQNRASGGAHCPHCRGNIQTLVKIHEVSGNVARGVEVRIPMARPC